MLKRGKRKEKVGKYESIQDCDVITAQGSNERTNSQGYLDQWRRIGDHQSGKGDVLDNRDRNSNRVHTSSALNITYSLMVSWPRIVWYILLASVRGFRISSEAMSSSARNKSAF